MNERLNTGVYVGKAYKTNEALRICNTAQAAAYWINGIKPLDIFPSRDNQTKKPIMVYVFSREETQEVYEAWVKHELK